MNPEFFTDLDFDGQTVRIPTRFSFTAKTTHRLITWKQILDRSREAVSRMRFTVRGGRPFIENEVRRVATLFERLLVNVLLLPKREDFFFEFGELHILRNGREHGFVAVRASVLGKVKANQ